MAISRISIVMLLFGVCLASCTEFNSKSKNSETTTNETLTDLNDKKMNSYISLIEIPATDLSRATNFYQAILNVKIEIMEMTEMQMGILPYENQVVTVVITKAVGYKPSADGVTIYLNGGENLQTILDKVEANGGKVVIPKTSHADESSYFAIFMDTEGNKIGLHSPN